MLQLFLLPSVLIAVFFLLGAFFLFLKKKGIGRFLIILGFLFYYLFSSSLISDFILLPLEKDYSPLKEEDMGEANKLVLLLGGRESDILRGSEVLRISHITGNDIDVIVSGTDPLNPKSEEASAVRNFFISRGLPAENIIIEGNSRNTWENARNVKEVVGEESFFLVTSAYHMKRAFKEFEKIGANPIPAPTDFKRKGEYNLFDFFPAPQNLKKSDLATREHFGMIYYNILSLTKPK